MTLMKYFKFGEKSWKERNKMNNDSKELFDNLKEVVKEIGYLDVMKITFKINPLESSLKVELNKLGVEFLQSAFGIEEEIIKKLCEKHLQQPLTIFSDEIKSLINERKGCE